MIDGYYYLHANGALLWKRAAPGVVEDFENSDFVRRYWPVDLSDRRCAWRILIEAAALGADPAAIGQRARTWHCTDADAMEYARRDGIGLSFDGGTWYASRHIGTFDPGSRYHYPIAAGETPLDAFAALFLQLHPQT